MTTSVIVAGARTPMGRLAGQLRDLPATWLGAHAIRAALTRAQVAPGEVDHVILGQVLQAGAGQNPARQAAVAAGLSMGVPATTINKVCLSGLNSIALADQLIRAGEFDTVVAGGMESMTNSPHLLPDTRRGIRYGDAEIVDSMRLDGLWDMVTDQSMGALTEAHNKRLGIGRVEQDEFAARSHQRAAIAMKNGLLAEEIAPIEIAGRKRDTLRISDDEGVRPDTTPASLSLLRPAFATDGTITAASSSPISDGAAAVVVMSREKAQALGLRWIAEIGAHGVVAGPDSSLQSQPAHAIAAALAKERMSSGDLDLVEVNEAFAAVGIQTIRELGVAEEIVNVNGGAIALGHPIGMSGARLALHLAHELRRRGGGVGAAALCGGGGQGDALILKVTG